MVLHKSLPGSGASNRPTPAPQGDHQRCATWTLWQLSILCRKTIGYREHFCSGGWRVNAQEVALGEDALGDEDGVEGLGEAAVDRGVGDGFDDLGRGQADVE